MDLAAELSGLPWGPTTSPWEGYERNIGYGVMSLPFSTGDVLALRVFPRSDFGGYLSVWHRDPAGAWSQYVDQAPIEAGCPRVWGPALTSAANARIGLDWTGPARLTVTMDDPTLTWQLELGRTPVLAALNAIHRHLPLWTWRLRTLVAARERLVRWLGLGSTSMSGAAPTGEHLVAVLRRMYWITGSAAHLDGRDLGRPVTLDGCPTIGGWPLPRRGVFAIGEAHTTTGDREQYEGLLERTTGTGA